MSGWFIAAIITLILWGFWGFFVKLATQYIDRYNVLVFSFIGSLLSIVIVLFLPGFKPQVNFKGITFATITGLSGGLGLLSFYFALSKGKTSVVVTMTALYPLLTILLCSLILKESLTLRQGIGIILALCAMILLAS